MRVCVSAVCSCCVEYMEVTTFRHQFLLSGGLLFLMLCYVPQAS